MQTSVVATLKRIVPAPVRRAARGVIRAARGPAYTYNRDGLATVHNCDFIQEPRFARAYAAGKATGSWEQADIQWRAHVIAWAAQRARSIPGDFVECGVNKGGLATVALQYADLPKTDKRMYLFDTYQGMADDLLTDAEKKLGLVAGTYEDCYGEVVDRFRPYGDQVRVVRGAVPYTLDQFQGGRVSFLSIDMNCAAPEVAAMEFFYPKLSPGAVVVFDDYGWKTHINQKHAIDAFFLGKPETVMSLPTGQGVVVKL
jgi:hypothetical protein